MKSQGPKRERLHSAEATQSGLTAEAPLSVARLPGYVPRRNFRIARTTSSSVYPVDGNTFEIVFVNPSFTESDGDQTTNTTDRQLAPAAWVHNLSDHFIPEGELVLAYQLGQQWFCEWPAQGSPLKLAISLSQTPHGQTGLVKLATANFTPYGQAFSAVNSTGTTWWYDTKLVVSRLEVGGVISDQFHVIRDYAATRLKGTVDANITGPGWFDLSDVSPQDGGFPDAETTAWLLDGYYLNANMEAIAHWNEEEGRWEAIGCCECNPTTTTPGPTTTAGPTTTTSQPTTTTAAPTTTTTSGPTTTTTSGPTTTTTAGPTTTTTSGPTTTTSEPTTTIEPTTTTPPGSCPGCDGGVPATVKVTMAGFTDVAGCSTCNDRNQEHTLEQVGTCSWYYYEGDAEDPEFTVTVSVSRTGATGLLFVDIQWASRPELGCAEGQRIAYNIVNPEGGDYDCMFLNVFSDEVWIMENDFGCVPGSVTVSS